MRNREFNNKDFENLWSLPHKKLSENLIEKSWRNFQKNNILKSTKASYKDFFKVGFAAALLLSLFSTYYYLEVYNPTIIINNYGFNDKEINLPDGSMVLLKEGGEISFKEHFDMSRGVELKGEAFFNIVKDSLREFNVVSGSIVTKVLGTKFSITENGENDVKISLYTGRLMVSVKGQAESLGLIPGESLSYRKGKTEIKKFDAILSFDLRNTFIDVNNMKLEQLINFLRKRFNYEFESSSYDNNERVTLRINKEDSLDEILNILSIINNMNYEIDEKNRKVEVLRKKKRVSTVK